MKTSAYDVIVIGAGPAGISAAGRAAAGGVRVLLLDAGDAPGGHFYKPLPPAFVPRRALGHERDLRELAAHRQSLARGGVEMVCGARVWGIFHDSEATFGDASPGAEADDGPFTLYVDANGEPDGPVTAPVIIVAPGVYDRPLPFPGWTLPGVLTPGAVDFLLQGQGLIPGDRIVVAGTGPLQIAVAAALVKSGAHVVALLDTSSAASEWRRLPRAFWGQWERISEAGRYMATLLAHRVPILFRHAVYRALGAEESGVTGVVAGRVDVEGHPIPGSEHTLEAETLCVAYGFAPSIELTLHLGCVHDYDRRMGVYFPRHNARMATSVPGVYVAGDVTGVGGKRLAELQGEAAAISALETLGALAHAAAEEQRKRLAPAVAGQVRYGRVLWERYRVLPGLFDLATDDTIVCRCENVTAGQVRVSVEDGAHDFRGAKLRTRVGMGTCQGRYCYANVAALMARQAGCPAESIEPLHVRPPVVAVPVRSLFAPSNEEVTS